MRKNKIKDFIITAGGEFKKAIKLVVNGIAEFVGEALSACETKKSISDIQAQGYLRNAQRIALRETPVVTLNQEQTNWLKNQAYCGFPEGVAYLPLDHAQAELVFQHGLRQYALDADSREQLANMVAPLVGIPVLMQSVYKAHEEIGKSLVLPYINHGKPDEYKKVYSDIVNAPFYEGTNRSIRLHYNLHSADLCEKFCGEYRKSRQYNAGLENDLQRIGVQISHVRAEGIHLKVYLKWA